jgi:hypothetical protein
MRKCDKIKQRLKQRLSLGLSAGSRQHQLPPVVPSSSKMKRAHDVFVSVNPISPKKRRRKKPIKKPINLTSHEEVLTFGDTYVASDSALSTVNTGPWTPLSTSGTWDSSRRDSGLLTPSSSFASTSTDSIRRTGSTGLDIFTRSDLFTWETTTADNDSTFTSNMSTPDDRERDFSLGPPVLLKLRNTANELLEASELHAYDTSSHLPRNSNTWTDCKRKVLKMISDASRSPLDLVLDILDPTQDEHEIYRSRWFTSARCSKISDLLDSIFAHPKGRHLILEWMRPHALESICSVVTSEMDLVSKELYLPSVEHISPQFISNWTLDVVIKPATELCPTLMCILDAAAQTEEAKQKNKIKNSKTVKRTSSLSIVVYIDLIHLGLRCRGCPTCISTLQ